MSGRGAGRRSAAQGRGLLLLYKLRTLGLIKVFYKSFAIHLGFSLSKGTPKGIKRYCMFKLV